MTRQTLGAIRLAAFLAATSESRTRFAARLGEHCDRGRDPSYVSHLVAGRCTPSLEIAVAIERLTALWREGPVRCDEWLRVAPGLTSCASPAEALAATG